MRRSLVAVLLLLALCALLFVTLGQAEDVRSNSKTARARVLPGIQANGFVQLPNQWSLKPVGRQVRVGDFPVNLALHPSGLWLAALHAGYGDHEVIILDLKKQKIACRVELEQTFYGLCFSPDGSHLYASGGEFEVVHDFEFTEGLLGKHRKRILVDEKQKFIAGGLAIDAAGKTLYAAGTWGHAVCVLPLNESESRTLIPLEKESFPYACTVDGPRRRLYVSLWSKAAVAVIDLVTNQVVQTWTTEKHPTEMLLAPNGKTLFVACANSTQVSVLNAETGQALSTISCALYPQAPSGNTPNSLCLTPDGQLLFVANADANNLAVFNVVEPEEAKPLGFIPTGWYPTSVRYNAADKRLYIANGKGMSSFANPQGPNVLAPRNQTIQQYIGGLMQGTIGILDLPTPEKMAGYSKQAYACSPLRSDNGVVGERSDGNPIPAKVGDSSPIRHVIYIIKENRTYDQVFGDIKEGNGDPNLCLFPERVTPNHHRLAREFVLLDNLYCDGEVSADGHQWSMGAYATDFVEKIWPLTYRGSPLKKLNLYPSEGAFDTVARPAGGYIWDRCAEAGLSYFSYGEWVDDAKKIGDSGKARVKALEGHFDSQFRGFDLDYPDQKRADRFLEELARNERDNSLPRLTILRLPNDHTAGSRVGKPTPTAYVADNDLALGRVVEAISNCKFWKETAIFVIEDDAQNGSDHVDAHRTVALVVSPYCRRGSVDSSLYSTSSLLRTMELILGLKPMSQFDAAARPMYASFQAQADARPYQHVVPNVDLKETTQANAWGAKESEKFDLTKEDAVDDLLFNEVIWRAVRGPNSPAPPPVRAAFVVPRGD